MPDFTDFTLRRPGGTDIAFKGELLAEETSKDYPDQQRWTEVRIYRTATGRYVTEQIGYSSVPGERPRGNVKIVDKATDVRTALLREGERGPYLTDLAYDALCEAGLKDHEIAKTVIEHI